MTNHASPRRVRYTDTIEEYLTVHNANPKSFIWTARAVDILEKVKRGRAKLDKLHSV